MRERGGMSSTGEGWTVNERERRYEQYRRGMDGDLDGRPNRTNGMFLSTLLQRTLREKY